MDMESFMIHHIDNESITFFVALLKFLHSYVWQYSCPVCIVNWNLHKKEVPDKSVVTLGDLDVVRSTQLSQQNDSISGSLTLFKLLNFIRCD